MVDIIQVQVYPGRVYSRKGSAAAAPPAGEGRARVQVYVPHPPLAPCDRLAVLHRPRSWRRGAGDPPEARPMTDVTDAPAVLVAARPEA